jgi:hypothetical protein
VRAVSAASILFVAAFIAGCGSSGSANPFGSAPKRALPTPTPVGLETPTGNGAFLGVFVAPTASGFPVQQLEVQIGRTFALDMHYDPWLTAFPNQGDLLDIGSARLPVNSWNCQFTNAQVAAGDEDPLITTRAQAVKAFGHPVFLRFFWDMNEPSSELNRASCADVTRDAANGDFNPTDFIAAWDHVRALFKSAGAENAIWVWSPSSSGVDPLPYYPGASEVDWVGIDAYDPLGAGFATVVGPTYAELAALKKPILVAEAGTLAAKQATYLEAVETTLPTQFPMIKGFMYYDAPAAQANWTLGVSGTTALGALGADPYFSAKATL